MHRWAVRKMSNKEVPRCQLNETLYDKFNTLMGYENDSKDITNANAPFIVKTDQTFSQWKLISPEGTDQN